MVKKGMVPIGGLITTIISIEELKTPAPTVSDKNSVDIGQKLRYLIDQTEAILAQVDVALGTRASEATLSDIKDVLDVALSTRASESTLSDLNAKIPSPIDDVFSKDVSVGASAVQLDPDTKVREAITLLADAANTDDILIGNSASQTFPLSPGSSLTLRKCSLSKIYAIAASGTQTLHVIAGGI